MRMHAYACPTLVCRTINSSCIQSATDQSNERSSCVLWYILLARICLFACCCRWWNVSRIVDEFVGMQTRVCVILLYSSMRACSFAWMCWLWCRRLYLFIWQGRLHADMLAYEHALFMVMHFCFSIEIDMLWLMIDSNVFSMSGTQIRIIGLFADTRCRWYFLQVKKEASTQEAVCSFMRAGVWGAQPPSNAGGLGGAAPQ